MQCKVEVVWPIEVVVERGSWVGVGCWTGLMRMYAEVKGYILGRTCR